MVKSKKALVEPDVTRIPNFDIVGDYQARSLISIVNTKHNEQIYIIALNCLSSVGQFDKGIVPILEATSNYIIYALLIYCFISESVFSSVVQTRIWF